MKTLRSFFLRNNYSVTIGSSFITNLIHNHNIEKKMAFYVFYMGCSHQYFDTNLSYYLNIWKYWIFVNTFTFEKSFFAFFTLINWKFFKFDSLWNLLDKKICKVYSNIIWDRKVADKSMRNQSVRKSYEICFLFFRSI